MYESKNPVVNNYIARFQADLGALLPYPTHDLPNLEEQIRGDVKYVKVDTGYDSGLLLSSTEEADEELGKVINGAFQPRPGHRLGREQSHNVVFFGQLVLARELGNESISVAVKSREHKDGRALAGELALFQRLGRVGLKTFNPVGLLHGDEAQHLLTEFDGPVTTMDVIEWKDLTLDEAWCEVKKAVDTMALLHSNMLFHGDLEFRNVAFNQSNETVIVDPELMVSGEQLFEPLFDAGMVLETEEQHQAETQLVRQVSREFSAVCKSIDEMILPLYPRDQRPRTPEQRLKAYKKHLFEPYKDRLRDENTPTRPVLLRVYDQVVALKKQFAKEEKL